MPSNQVNFPDLSINVRDINKAKATVTVEADKMFFSRAIHRVEPYKNLPYVFRPALIKVAQYVRTVMIPETFEREGPGWRPLARRTVAERIQAGFGGHHPILRRSGDLFRELTERSHPGHVEFIKTGKYARIEIGGSSTKFIENQMGRPAEHLPSRPMLPGTGNIPISQRDRIAIRSILTQAIEDRLNDTVSH